MRQYMKSLTRHSGNSQKKRPLRMCGSVTGKTRNLQLQETEKKYRRSKQEATDSQAE